MKAVNPSGLDPAFVQRQRERLLLTRSTLMAASDAAESDEVDIKTQRSSAALEAQEDAQGLDADRSKQRSRLAEWAVTLPLGQVRRLRHASERHRPPAPHLRGPS